MALFFGTIPSEYHLNLFSHLGSKLGTVPVSPVFLKIRAYFCLYTLSIVKSWADTGMPFQHYWEDENVKLAILTQPSKQDILIHISNCLDNHLASKKMTNLHMQARLSEVWKKATLTPAVKLHADLSPTETLINL